MKRYLQSTHGLCVSDDVIFTFGKSPHILFTWQVPRISLYAFLCMQCDNFTDFIENVILPQDGLDDQHVMIRGFNFQPTSVFKRKNRIMEKVPTIKFRIEQSRHPNGTLCIQLRTASSHRAPKVGSTCPAWQRKVSTTWCHQRCVLSRHIVGYDLELDVQPLRWYTRVSLYG